MGRLFNKSREGYTKRLVKNFMTLVYIIKRTQTYGLFLFTVECTMLHITVSLHSSKNISAYFNKAENTNNHSTTNLCVIVLTNFF